MSNVPSPVKQQRANDNFRSDPQLNRTANEFQSDAAAIEEAPVPISAHAALWIVLISLLVEYLFQLAERAARPKADEKKE